MQAPRENLLLSVCTWNVDGGISDEDDVKSLLEAQGHDRAVDIHVFGVQELGSLNVRNIFGQDGDLRRQNDIIDCLDKALGDEYKRLESIGMVGLFLVVYVHCSMWPTDIDAKGDCVERDIEVEGDRVKRGRLGLIGNKGAVCLSFTINQMKFCFANVHIAAGAGNMARRAADLDAILHEAFQSTSPSGVPRAPQGSLIRRRSISTLLPKDDTHDITVLLGDFNFRLAVPSGVLLPEDNDPLSWRSVLQYDEGQQWLRNYGHGAGFHEADIEFGPSYKYRRGDEVLDRRSRKPAWCDRIFLQCSARCHETCISNGTYKSRGDMKHTSDHRPVIAQIEVRRGGALHPSAPLLGLPRRVCAHFVPDDVLELQRPCVRLLVLFGGFFLVLPSLLGLLILPNLFYHSALYFAEVFRLGIGILVVLMAVSTLGPAVQYAAVLYSLWGRGFFYLFVASLLSYTSQWYASMLGSILFYWILSLYYQILDWYFVVLFVLHMCMQCKKRHGATNPPVSPAAGDATRSYAGDEQQGSPYGFLKICLRCLDIVACIGILCAWLASCVYFGFHAFNFSRAKNRFHPLAYLSHIFQILLSLAFIVTLGMRPCLPWPYRCISRYAKIFNEPFGRLCFFLFESSCMAFEEVHIRKASATYPFTSDQFEFFKVYLAVGAWSLLGIAACHLIEARRQIFILWRYMRGHWLYRPEHCSPRPHREHQLSAELV